MNVNPLRVLFSMEYRFQNDWTSGKTGSRKGISNGISDLWNLYLYSSLFLATAAAGMAFISCLLQGIGFSWACGAVLSLVVFSVYNLNRKTDMTEDSLNHADRFRVTSRHGSLLYFCALGAYALALGISAFHGLLPLVSCGIPLVFGLFYSLPLLPRGCRYRRLKEVPLVKNFVVSVAWGFSFSFVPVSLSQAPAGKETLIVFLFIFSWTFIASVLPDIRDSRGDEAAGVRTVPVILGAGATEFLLVFFNVVIGVCILAVSIGTLGMGSLVILSSSLAYSHGCILLINRVTDKNFLCDVLSDGQVHCDRTPRTRPLPGTLLPLHPACSRVLEVRVKQQRYIPSP